MRQTRPAVLLAAALSAALSAAGAARARAQTSIVVPWDGLSTYTCTAGSAFRCGQRFTVPTASAVLQRFTYQIETASALSFALYALSGTQVAGPALFAQSFGPTAGFQPLTFAPAGGLALTGGATYAALVLLDAGEQVAFRSNASGPYAGGDVLGGCQPGCATNPPAGDLAFTATFVPEPVPLGALALGLLALGARAAARRRRWATLLPR